MTVYTIYKHPSDYPHSYVVRKFTVGPGTVTPANECVVAPTLATARLAVPQGYTVIAEQDPLEPQIVETWV